MGLEGVDPTDLIDRSPMTMTMTVKVGRYRACTPVHCSREQSLPSQLQNFPQEVWRENTQVSAGYIYCNLSLVDEIGAGAGIHALSSSCLPFSFQFPALVEK